MINTHEKLMEAILMKEASKEILSTVLKGYGYKGTEQDMIVDMLGAMADTSALLFSTRQMNNKVRTEEEYWEVLTKQMNLNY